MLVKLWHLALGFMPKPIKYTGGLKLILKN